MADWSDRDYCLNRIEAYYGYAFGSVANAGVHWQDAYNEMFNPPWDWTTAIDDLLWCLSDIILSIKYLIVKDVNYDPPYLIPYFCKYHAGGVTWEQIVEAWIEDDFEGRAMTIATIDRMRQILWNEPFDVKWAARPELGGV